MVECIPTSNSFLMVTWIFLLEFFDTCKCTSYTSTFQGSVVYLFCFVFGKDNKCPECIKEIPTVFNILLFAPSEVPLEHTTLKFVSQSLSVAKSCPTFCDHMNHSVPGLPVHHQFPEFTQTHPLSQWCHLTISSSVVAFSSCLQSLPTSGYFQMSQLFASGGQNIGVSASTSVLPVNNLDWSPSGWTGWISAQSKGLSRVFSNTTVQKHQFFSGLTRTSTHDHWKNHSLD